MPKNWHTSTLTSTATGALSRSLFAQRFPHVFDVILEISGKGAKKLLSESGGHRYQGRSGNKIHTSTITVVALEKELETKKSLWNLDDIEIIRTKDSGAGGQHKNKTQSTIVAIHGPTGIKVKTDGRKQGQNLKIALEELEKRVHSLYGEKTKTQEDNTRKNLAGSGERADKIRTYREQDNIVIDHRSGTKQTLTSILAGKLP